MNNDTIVSGVTTIGDECNRVDVEMNTTSKYRAFYGVHKMNVHREEIVYSLNLPKENKLMECLYDNSSVLLHCSVCGRELTIKQARRNKNGEIFCPKHYQQILKYGHVLDNNPRTQQDLNDFEVDDENYCIKINLYNRQQEFMGQAIIDVDDFEDVIVHKWRFWKGRVFTGNIKPIDLAHFVLCRNDWDPLPPGTVIDHINRNPLDNRKCNLRITYQQMNTMNRSVQTNNTTNFVGISIDKSRNQYAVEIRFNKKVHLGRYDKLEDAVFVRYTAECLVFQQYRSTQNDANILPLVEKCQRKEELYNYTYNKLKSHLGEFINI